MSVCVCVCVCVRARMCCDVLSHSVVSDSAIPMNYSPAGSSVHGILQAAILEWVTISFSRRSSQPRGRTHVSHSAGVFLPSEPPGKHPPRTPPPHPTQSWNTGKLRSWT